MYKSKQWVKFPFDESTLVLISDVISTHSLRAVSTLKIEFNQVSVDQFWIRSLDN